MMTDSFLFFFNVPATTEIYTLSLHDALPISRHRSGYPGRPGPGGLDRAARSEEHTSELQSRFDLVCRLLLEKKNHNIHVDSEHEHKLLGHRVVLRGGVR